MLSSLSRPFASFVALALVASLAACTDTDLPSTTEPVTGSGLVYSLATVDNRVVPAPVVVAEGTVTVVRGKLTLAPDSSWIVSHILAVGANSSATTLRGTYTRSGGTLRLNQSNGLAFTGTWTESAVTLASSVSTVVGAAFTYTR